MLREQAEREAIHSYARSLRDLLMAAPAGPRTVMGIDPGLRTGIKVAVVDPAGTVLESATLFPHQPKNEWDQSVGGARGPHRAAPASISWGSATAPGRARPTACCRTSRSGAPS